MIRKLIASVAVTVLALTSFTAPVTAQVLRLKTGKFVIGSVEEANEDGLRVRRLDTGGVLDLVWDDVAEIDATKLRKRFSLLDDTELADVLFPATKLVHMRPAGRATLIGELVARQGNDFIVRKKGQTFKISVDQLRGTPESVDVPIQDVLLPDEIYQRKLDEIDPAEDADKHLLLAAYLIRVGDYPRAKEHLLKSQELGSGAQPQEVEAQLARVASLEANKAEADLIQEINVYRNRKNFAKAMQLAKEYETKYASGRGKLVNEYKKRRAQLEKDRETWLVREVSRQWYRLLLDEAGRVSRTVPEFEKARDFSEEQMGQNIRQRIAKRYEITPEEAELLFRKRLERRVGGVQSTTYSTGSWILGESKITAGTAAQKQDKKGKQEDDPNDKIRREMRKRMEEWVRQAARAGGKQAQTGQELQTEDEWWQDVESTTRKFWLVSWYVENAGDMEVVSAHTSNCPTCGGRGSIATASSTGNKVIQNPCQTCHKTKYLRIVRYR